MHVSGAQSRKRQKLLTCGAISRPFKQCVNILTYNGELTGRKEKDILLRLMDLISAVIKINVVAGWMTRVSGSNSAVPS